MLTKTLVCGIRNHELGSKLFKSLKDSYKTLEHLELPSSYSADQELSRHIIWANSIEFPHWLVSRFNLNNIAVSFSENKNAPKYEKSSLEPFITVFKEL